MILWARKTIFGEKTEPNCLKIIIRKTSRAGKRDQKSESFAVSLSVIKFLGYTTMQDLFFFGQNLFINLFDLR